MKMAGTSGDSKGSTNNPFKERKKENMSTSLYTAKTVFFLAIHLITELKIQKGTFVIKS